MPLDGAAALDSNVRSRPNLSFWQIWNMCFGFLGLQFGFALQNANVSRIFQTLGASVDDIPALWIAAPLTGLLVQPVIGYLSDRTWTALGRRRPYFLFGALLASIALFFMPRSPNLLVAAALLWVLDASINVSMEPFRAFVGDQLAPVQRPSGYAMQSFFIGIGAVIASMLPYLLARLGVSNHADTGPGASAVPETVHYAFYVGAAVLLAAIGWTVVRTKEYPPTVLRSFTDTRAAVPRSLPDAHRATRHGALWCCAGAAGIAAIRLARLDPQLYLVSVGALIWGAARMFQRGARRSGLFGSVMEDIETMPTTMRRLVPVQFFSWLALFAMWIYTTSAVSEVHFGSADPHSEAYNQGANWVGVLFAAYNGFAALAAIVIPVMVRRFGIRLTHMVNVWLGGAALLSFLVIRDSNWLLASMIGVGFAWASILSLPYALLSDSVPAEKMGLYMGVFNFFIVIPQLVAASVLGVALKLLFAGEPIYALAIGGASFFVAGLLVLRVPEP
ncbi:MAG: MFS transporter [Steroidobacteraceae bacterium]|jgi:maltose/moltooligosaccharide transporter